MLAPFSEWYQEVNFDHKASINLLLPLGACYGGSIDAGAANLEL
jgi:hypothetical protein